MVNLHAAMAGVAPHANALVWTTALEPVLGNINTTHRIAAFLGQVAVESEGFSHLEEDLFYTTPEHLVQVWPSHFASSNDALPYTRNPEKLANHVYANRMGNGNEASGDGWKFRGVGLIQLTGRAAYDLFAKHAGKTPEDAATWMQTPEGAAAAAVWFWNSKNLNPLADIWHIAEITVRVNGGRTNLAQRLLLSGAALKALNAPPTV